VVGRLSKVYAAARFACETRVLINLHTIARMFVMVDPWFCPALDSAAAAAYLTAPAALVLHPLLQRA